MHARMKTRVKTYALLLIVVCFGTGCGLVLNECSEDDPACNPSRNLLQFIISEPTRTETVTYPTHLYAADNAGNFQGYSIDRNSGFLTPLFSTATGATIGTQLWMGPNQDFVLVPTRSGGSTGVYVYSLADPDNPVAVSGSPFDPGVNQTLTTVSSDGRFYYASSGTAYRGMTVDSSTGTMTTMTGSPFGSACVGAMVVDAESTYLYGIDRFNSNSFEYYAIDTSTGALTLQSGQNPGYIIDFFTQSSTANRVYGAANVAGTWSMLSVNATPSTGAPTITSTTGVGTVGDTPTGLDASQDDSRLVVPENFRGTVQSFTINSDGSTTFNQEVTDGTVLNGGTVRVSPADDFAWITNNANEIITYQINADGSLSRLSSISTPGGRIDGMQIRTVTESVPVE